MYDIIYLPTGNSLCFNIPKLKLYSLKDAQLQLKHIKTVLYNLSILTKASPAYTVKGLSVFKQLSANHAARQTAIKRTGSLGAEQRRKRRAERLLESALESLCYSDESIEAPYNFAATNKKAAKRSYQIPKSKRNIYKQVKTTWNNKSRSGTYNLKNPISLRTSLKRHMQLMFDLHELFRIDTWATLCPDLDRYIAYLRLIGVLNEPLGTRQMFSARMNIYKNSIDDLFVDTPYLWVNNILPVKQVDIASPLFAICRI